MGMKSTFGMYSMKQHNPGNLALKRSNNKKVWGKGTPRTMF